MSVFRCQARKTQELNPDTSAQETGITFLRNGPARWEVFIIFFPSRRSLVTIASLLKFQNQRSPSFLKPDTRHLTPYSDESNRLLSIKHLHILRRSCDLRFIRFFSRPYERQDLIDLEENQKAGLAFFFSRRVSLASYGIEQITIFFFPQLC